MEHRKCVIRMRPGNFAFGEANKQILAGGYVSPIRASCELQLVPKAENMSDSEDSNFSEEEDRERSSDGKEAEVEEERRQSAAGSEKEEEPEEEEEEEEYDEEEDDDRPPKKPHHGGFILDEADVDDEYEDEDQWEDGAEDILEKASNIDNVVLDEDRSGACHLQNLWRDQREEELGKYYMKKYARSSVGETVCGGSDELSDDITQHQLLPGVKNPNLWTVKCKIGEERATAISLMRKFIAYQFTDTPLQIKSVVAPEHMKGYIYVEACREPVHPCCFKGPGIWHTVLNMFAHLLGTMCFNQGL